MTERLPIAKRLRFEVFKRDLFTCQYCGQRAPNVLLYCDHVTPVAKGGANTLTNLITACFDCNSGKGVLELSQEALLAAKLQQYAAGLVEDLGYLIPDIPIRDATYLIARALSIGLSPLYLTRGITSPTWQSARAHIENLMRRVASKGVDVETIPDIETIDQIIQYNDGMRRFLNSPEFKREIDRARAQVEHIKKNGEE